MGEFLTVAGVIGGFIVLLIWSLGRPGGRTFSGGPGAGASGAVYDMLNEDRRKAIEIIVEGRAEYRDPETADDQPPDEEAPAERKRKPRDGV
jgi:hypothetical protein